jgi:hypothetical protein
MLGHSSAKMMLYLETMGQRGVMRIFAAILGVALLAGAARADDLAERLPVLRIEAGSFEGQAKSHCCSTVRTAGGRDRSAA